MNTGVIQRFPARYPRRENPASPEQEVQNTDPLSNSECQSYSAAHVMPRKLGFHSITG